MYDAVIVGSGAGGSAAAWSLSHAGLRVLVLEAGPRFDPFKDYSLHLPDWELHGFPTPAGSQGEYRFGAMQALDERWQDLRSWNHLHGRSVRGRHRQVGAYHHVRGVGGTTLKFSGEAHRLHPQAMQMQSRFQVGADWPLTYEELEPFYVEAENVLGVAGPLKDSQRTRSAALPLPAHELSYASQKVATGCKKLGLNWQANSLAILSRPYGDRPACNYCANCARGCPRTDKGSADVTFLHQAQATGRCEVLPEVTVTGLEAGPQDQLTALTYVNSEGETHRVGSALFVVAAGAVETPRLLLSSGSGQDSHGLANESGQVGRNFLETLYWSSHGLHAQPLGSHRGVPVDGICWDFNAPDSIPGVVGGVRFSITTAESRLNGPLAYATRVVPGWGRTHKQAMRDTFGKVLGVGAIGESLPNERSYIDMDPESVDANGIPLARIHSYLPDSELNRLRFMASKSRDILQASGVDRIFEESSSYDLFSSTHVFGTCRMGQSAATSVVDSNCRSHRWKNLYITDASVFPSSGGGESPSLTIQALAIRAARHMRAALARRDVSSS